MTKNADNLVDRLRRQERLTDSQVLAAHKFRMTPGKFHNLPPSMFRVAFDLLVRGEGLEAYETRRGWASRSAKVVLSLILHSLTEIGEKIEKTEEEASTQEKLDWVTATGETDLGELENLRARYGMTPIESRLFLILKRANGLIGKEAIHRRLYIDRVTSDIPDSKIVDVLVCKLRAKIIESEFQIDTVWGQGYKLRSRDAKLVEMAKHMKPYLLRAAEGLGYVQVAKRLGITPEEAFNSATIIERMVVENAIMQREVSVAIRDHLLSCTVVDGDES